MLEDVPETSEICFEGQAAPEMGDDDFALFQRQRMKFGRCQFGVGRIGPGDERIALEPTLQAGGGPRFMAAPTPGGFRGIDGPVAHHAEEPGRRIGRQSTLPRQLEERFLDHVLGRLAPLPRVKLEGRRVPIYQSPKNVRVHACIAPRPRSILPLLSL